MRTTIKIIDEIKDNIFITEKDGETIYNLIKSKLDNDENIILDCTGIETSIVKPFHICVGRFFDTTENARKFLTHVQIKGNDYIKEKINRVIDNAQKFYNSLEEE